MAVQLRFQVRGFRLQSPRHEEDLDEFSRLDQRDTRLTQLWRGACSAPWGGSGPWHRRWHVEGARTPDTPAQRRRRHTGETSSHSSFQFPRHALWGRRYSRGLECAGAAELALRPARGRYLGSQLPFTKGINELIRGSRWKPKVVAGRLQRKANVWFWSINRQHWLKSEWACDS